MSELLRYVSPESLISAWDFSTGSVKALLFDLSGNVKFEYRLPTDLWTEGGVSELSVFQLEGQAHATVRAISDALKQMKRCEGRLRDWRAGGISATHHSATRIDGNKNPVRRLICWNDQTLAKYHAEGLERLGGQARARELTGGPWAVRYSLSHLVKDEHTLSEKDWRRTWRMLPHGPLAAGYLTGEFSKISPSSSASTGMLDLRTGQWSQGMLDALARADYRSFAWENLPALIDMNQPLGQISSTVVPEWSGSYGMRPLIFPTLDDQAAGLLGGGAVDAGQVAVILGNSAVVNSSASTLPKSGNLDAMLTNWGPYLWMRCYSNGAQFLDRIVGPNPDWEKLEAAARAVPAGCNGVSVLPFVLSEPSIGVTSPRFEWFPSEPSEPGVRLRASFEAIAYLIALGVKEHEAAGQTITRITVSGGISRSELMVEILASVFGRPVVRLASDEGTALGAAVVALAGLESWERRRHGPDWDGVGEPPVSAAPPFSVAEAVDVLVKFRGSTDPRPDWIPAYQNGLTQFSNRISPTR